MADASALVAELLRARGEQRIAHRDLEIFIAAPMRSEVDYELGRRLGAMVRDERINAQVRERMYERAMALLSESLTELTEATYGRYELESRDRIPRDANDWPTVAAALALDAGIWTVDDDFFGCGVPVWTTDTLLTHVLAGRAHLDG